MKTGKFFKFFLIFTILESLVGCRTVRVVEQVPVHIHDTLRLTQTLRDSIYIDHFREVTQKDDTIYITDSVSVIKYSLITDTAYRYIERPVPVVRTEQVEVEKPLNWLQKTLIYTGGFVILLAAAVIWWECRRYKKQCFANGFANRKTATN
jgi:hypothetical protein